MSLHPEAKQLWKEIRNKGCTECELHKSAQTVCLVGDGPVPCDLMIVGEAPGFREDEIHKPFSGRAGQLLDASLTAVGLKRGNFFITNVVKCRPPENRTPTRGEIKTCRHYLEDEIEAVKPKFILTVGNSGLSLVKKSGIMKQRGNPIQYGDAVVFPTIHPAAVLRNPRYEVLWRTDLQAFARLIKGQTSDVKTRTFLVKNKKSLTACLQAILKAKAVAYDIETNGFEEHAPGAKIACVGVSPAPGVAFVVPIHHPETPWKDPQRVLDAITGALAYTPAKRIAHNAKFDDRWLSYFSKNRVSADFDTMIAAHLLDENRPKGLKVLSPIFLGVDPWAIDMGDGKAMETPLNKLAVYNGKDCDYTLRLYHIFREQLLQEDNARTLRIFVKLMMPASRALTAIEANGIWIDQKRLAERRIEVTKRLADINRKLSKYYGQEANWNSFPTIADFVFGKLKLPMFDMTGTGNPSTKESVLLRLKDQHPAIPLILEWRKWSKTNSTYLVNWSEKLSSEGRIHPNYKTTGTVTGRLSSGKEEGNKQRGLNVQQVPRDPLIRGILGAPPGWRFVEADFSQIELRIAAHYSGDPTLQRIFQLGQDAHMTMAMKLTGKPAEHVTKEERKKAKSVNFGFLFGMGAQKYVDYARDNYELLVTLEEAKNARDQYFTTYSKLPAWHERQRRLARTYKYVTSLIGRTRHLTDIDSEDKEVRAEAERQAINSPVQGLASDFMLLALIALQQIMDPSEAKIVGTVHDSILFEIREDVVDKWVKVIRKTMENPPLKKVFGVTFDVPIVVDIKVGQHWSEDEAA